MEMNDFWGLIFSEVAQAKFLHTVTAGYTTAGIFVVGVSAYLMLKRKSFQFAKRSMTIGLLFALCAMGGSGLSGDISALLVTKHQPAKLAAMEAEFHTQEPPAAWSLFAIPNEDEMDNYVSIKIPALLGLIATHSIDTPVKGLRDIVAENEQRVRSGLIANRTLTAMRSGDVSDENMELFKAHQKDLGYGLLLVEHAADPLNPTEQEIKTAARHSVPSVTLNYFAFRVMLGIVSVLGLLCVAAGYFLIYKNDLQARPKVLKVLVLAIPLPFICCEAGWILAEFGRQPWAIQDVLPTYLATSSLSPVDVGISLLCFIGIYTVLLLIEMKMMVKAIKKGPEITEPEEDGKGYPPLPPQGPQGADAKETQETQETVAVADASVQAASEAAPAQESEAASAAEAQAVSAQADDKEKTEAQGKDDSAKGGALNAV